MMERTCYLCTWWEQKTFLERERNTGLCRLSPPTRNGSDEHEWTWPVTYDEDWCSQFVEEKR